MQLLDQIKQLFIVNICMAVFILGTAFPALADQDTVSAKPDEQIVSDIKSAPQLKKTVGKLAEELVQNLEMTASRRVSGSEGLIVCTFVDLNKLYRTSSFGRYIAEQLMGEFQQQGFRVVEMRKSTSIMVQEKHGEYGLSRKPDEIRPETAASVMLTGTYMPTDNYIIVNARIMDNRDSTLLSSATALFPRNVLAEQLLADSSTGVKKSRGPLYMKRLAL